MQSYKINTNYWNDVFKNVNGKKIIDKSIGHKDVDLSLDWLCEGVGTILDFGCGNGVWLYKCFLRGTKEHIGIDISEEGIRVAKEIQNMMDRGQFTFTVGVVEAIEAIPSDSVDGVLLSNIIDNLIPKDTIKVLDEVKRILKTGGKIFIKLNPYIQEEKIKEWNIKVIEGNFLDDGPIPVEPDN